MLHQAKRLQIHMAIPGNLLDEIRTQHDSGQLETAHALASVLHDRKIAHRKGGIQEGIVLAAHACVGQGNLVERLRSDAGRPGGLISAVAAVAARLDGNSRLRLIGPERAPCLDRVAGGHGELIILRRNLSHSRCSNQVSVIDVVGGGGVIIRIGGENTFQADKILLVIGVVALIIIIGNAYGFQIPVLHLSVCSQINLSASGYQRFQIGRSKDTESSCIIKIVLGFRGIIIGAVQGHGTARSIFQQIGIQGNRRNLETFLLFPKRQIDIKHRLNQVGIAVGLIALISEVNPVAVKCPVIILQIPEISYRNIKNRVGLATCQIGRTGLAGCPIRRPAQRLVLKTGLYIHVGIRPHHMDNRFILICIIFRKIAVVGTEVPVLGTVKPGKGFPLVIIAVSSSNSLHHHVNGIVYMGRVFRNILKAHPDIADISHIRQALLDAQVLNIIPGHHQISRSTVYKRGNLRFGQKEASACRISVVGQVSRIGSPHKLQTEYTLDFIQLCLGNPKLPEQKTFGLLLPIYRHAADRQLYMENAVPHAFCRIIHTCIEVILFLKFVVGNVNLLCRSLVHTHGPALPVYGLIRHISGETFHPGRNGILGTDHTPVVIFPKRNPRGSRRRHAIHPTGSFPIVHMGMVSCAPVASVVNGVGMLRIVEAAAPGSVVMVVGSAEFPLFFRIQAHVYRVIPAEGRGTLQSGLQGLRRSRSPFQLCIDNLYLRHCAEALVFPEISLKQHVASAHGHRGRGSVQLIPGQCHGKGRSGRIKTCNCNLVYAAGKGMGSGSCGNTEGFHQEALRPVIHIHIDAGRNPEFQHRPDHSGDPLCPVKVAERSRHFQGISRIEHIPPDLFLFSGTGGPHRIDGRPGILRPVGRRRTCKTLYLPQGNGGIGIHIKGVDFVIQLLFFLKPFCCSYQRRSGSLEIALEDQILFISGSVAEYLQVEELLGNRTYDSSIYVRLVMRREHLGIHVLYVDPYGSQKMPVPQRPGQGKLQGGRIDIGGQLCFCKSADKSPFVFLIGIRRTGFKKLNFRENAPVIVSIHLVQHMGEIHAELLGDKARTFHVRIPLVHAVHRQNQGCHAFLHHRSGIVSQADVVGEQLLVGNRKKLLSLPPEIVHHCINGGIGHLEDQGSVIPALVLIEAVVDVFVGKAISPACHLIVQIRLALAGGVASTYDFHILVLLGIRIRFL